MTGAFELASAAVLWAAMTHAVMNGSHPLSSLFKRR
jgi:hypothetical protein